MYNVGDEIVPGVHVGGVDDAETIRLSSRSWGIISVKEDPDTVPDWCNTRHRVHWLPIMEGARDDLTFRARKRMLDAVAEVIQDYQDLNIDVLVHCGNGIERGPLAVAWYLDKFQHAETITEAYDIIENERPQIQRRTHWLDFA